MELRTSPIAVLIYSAVLASPFFARHSEQKDLSTHAVEYSQVVDRAFQFSQGIPAEFTKMDYRIVLRFLPSGGPESQIVILWTEHSREIRIIHYRLKQGIRPISEEYTEALDKEPAASVEDILKRITVEKHEESVTQKKASLVEQFFRLSIPVKMSPALCMDGTTYDLWVQTPSNQIHTTLSDCAYGKNTESTPLFLWIKAVQREFQKGT